MSAIQAADLFIEHEGSTVDNFNPAHIAPFCFLSPKSFPKPDNKINQ